MKKLLFTKPITLSDTAEHRIHTRKWWAILILIVGGLVLSGERMGIVTGWTGIEW